MVLLKLFTEPLKLFFFSILVCNIQNSISLVMLSIKLNWFSIFSYGPLQYSNLFNKSHGLIIIIVI